MQVPPFISPPEPPGFIVRVQATVAKLARSRPSVVGDERNKKRPFPRLSLSLLFLSLVPFRSIVSNYQKSGTGYRKTKTASNLRVLIGWDIHSSELVRGLTIS